MSQPDQPHPYDGRPINVPEPQLKECPECGVQQSEDCALNGHAVCPRHHEPESPFPTTPGDMGDLVSREERGHIAQFVESGRLDRANCAPLVRRLLLTLDEKDAELALVRREAFPLIAAMRGCIQGLIDAGMDESTKKADSYPESPFQERRARLYGLTETELLDKATALEAENERLREGLKFIELAGRTRDNGWWFGDEARRILNG